MPSTYLLGSSSLVKNLTNPSTLVQGAMVRTKLTAKVCRDRIPDEAAEVDSSLHEESSAQQGSQAEASVRYSTADLFAEGFGEEVNSQDLASDVAENPGRTARGGRGRGG